MKCKKALIAAAVCSALLMTTLAGCVELGVEASKEPVAKGNPVAIAVWHYYNGDQQKMFDQFIQEFNESVGTAQGIVVVANSYGGVNELNEKVLDAVYEKVGAAEVPDIFASYADTAYEINGLGKVADISQYLTEEEQAAYISGYMEEGRFEENGGYKIFPIAKSTELLTLNKTEWDSFAAATGADEGKLATWEGVAALAEEYYLWTDSLTPDVAEDGKAFFGRDAFANYMIIGSLQLGAELFRVEADSMTLNVDESAMRRLWENYYVPFVNGYFGAFGKFRSDDIRTGVLAACVGATSGASYFPTEVTRDDGSTYPIEGAVYPLPNFEGTKPYAVQQGAGMVVTKSTPERERAAIEFLKWFTAPEQNVRFATGSGYLPVTYEAASSGKSVLKNKAVSSAVLQETLELGLEMVDSYEFYTSKAFANGMDARNVADKSMRELAAADRAAVLELMAGGMPRAEAVALYDTEENFQNWLAGFRSALEATLAS